MENQGIGYSILEKCCWNKKIAEKNKQFLIEKIIHRIEFENLYATNSERKPEIMSTIERNYRIARRIYQQLHIDTAELFA